MTKNRLIFALSLAMVVGLVEWRFRSLRRDLAPLVEGYLLGYMNKELGNARPQDNGDDGASYIRFAE